MPPARIQAAIQYPSAERPNVKKPSTKKTRTPRGIKDIIMRERSLQTADDAARLVQESGLSHIKIGLSDIDGVMRGKYLRKDKFLSAPKSGLAFCDVVMGWDSTDAMYANVQFTGWHTAYRDHAVRIDPKSGRRLTLATDATGEHRLFLLAAFDGKDAEG